MAFACGQVLEIRRTAFELSRRAGFIRWDWHSPESFSPRSIGWCCGEGSGAASILSINRNSGTTSETSGIGRKKPGTRLNSQLEHDGWRLLASLEHLSGATRAALGSELLRKLRREPTDSGWLWSLGRFGVRIPLYGALSCVIPAETAADWITALLDLRELTHETASAVVQLGRRVDHRTRDIGRDVVRSAIAELTSAGVADDIFLRPLHEYIAPGRADVVRTFGEPLPKGLELESTANCLSSITALTS